MLNTGNLLGNGLLGSIGINAKQPAAPVPATAAPAAPNPTALMSPMAKVAATPPSLNGLIPLTPPNPNADAINTAHAATMKALNIPQNPPANQSTPTSGGASTFSLTPDQIAAAKTPLQLSQTGAPQAATGSTGASTGLVPPGVGANPTPGSVGGLLGNTSLNPLPQISSLETEAASIANALPGAEAAIKGSPGIAADQEGREANLAAAGGAQLAGIGDVLGQLNATQSNIQGGLANAGGLLTPSNNLLTVPFNQQLVGADGQPIGGATGSAPLQSAVVNAINLIKSGSGYSNAVAAANLGQFGPQGTTALLNALGPKFNVNMADADAAAVAQNINTSSTASTNAANTAYSNAVQTVSKNTGEYNAATGVGQNLTDTLGTWTQNGQLTSLNQGINTVAGLTSSPQYSQFLAALTNTQAAYTAAFQNAGITPTQSTQNALQELNPNSSAQAILASLNQLSSDLHAATIVPAYQQQSTYAQQLGIQ